MHPLLERQIKKHYGGIDGVPKEMESLIEAIDAAYIAADEDRELMERSMDLVSKELLQRNDELSRQIKDKQKALDELNESKLQLLDALQQVQEMNIARSNFINAAAHELGTPLTPLILQVKLVKDRLAKAPDEKQLRSVEILERNVDRLNHLVTDLVDSAKLQTDRFDMDEQDTDLGAIVSGAVDAFTPIAKEVGVQLTAEETSFVPVFCDPTRIGQVMDNLLSNALKFTPRKGHVDVRMRVEGDMAEVSVRDDGRGISKKGLDRLFRPFTQVHDEGYASNAAGTGLGLYICKGVVEHSGGRIWAESEGTGKGATFTFTLPLSTGSDE